MKTKKIITTILTGAMLMSMLGACSSSDTDSTTAEPAATTERPAPAFRGSFDVNDPGNAYDPEQMNESYLTYAIRSFTMTAGNETGDSNIMISPASIALAMEMTGAGSCDDTLRQITDLIAPDATPEEVQAFMADINQHLNNNDYFDLHSANSVWMNEDIVGDHIKDDFLNFIREYYSAEAQSLQFDTEALELINEWIEEKTNGMIPDMLKELEPSAAMVLVNAIAFEAQWATPYEDYQVHENEIFHNNDGTESEVTMLYDTLNWYYETDFATGFCRYYEGGEYYFLAMLPTDDSISANEFAASLTAEDWNEFINSRDGNYLVYTRMPEFESDYEVGMTEILKQMGVTDAFTEAANFDNIAEIPGYYLYISKVLHKTHIELDRYGTRAAAATAVTLDAACAFVEEETREVYLDRPYVYAIVDSADNTPLFIGTVNSL